MYYTIINNELLVAGSEDSLTRFYSNVFKLPEDYKPGKYIVENENLVLNLEYENEIAKLEELRKSQLKLSKREVFLALYQDRAITPEQIKNQIQDVSSLIEFEYANDYYRGNPLIDKIGESLGYSKEDLDYLFENKTFPPREVTNDRVVF